MTPPPPPSRLFLLRQAPRVGNWYLSSSDHCVRMLLCSPCAPRARNPALTNSTKKASLNCRHTKEFLFRTQRLSQYRRPTVWPFASPPYHSLVIVHGGIMETPFRELWSLGDSGLNDVSQPASAGSASPAIIASLRPSRDERHTFQAAALSQPGNREQRQAQSGSRSSYALCVHTSRKVHADSAPQAHCDRTPPPPPNRMLPQMVPQNVYRKRIIQHPFETSP